MIKRVTFFVAMGGFGKEMLKKSSKILACVLRKVKPKAPCHGSCALLAREGSSHNAVSSDLFSVASCAAVLRSCVIWVL